MEKIRARSELEVLMMNLCASPSEFEAILESCLRVAPDHGMRSIIVDKAVDIVRAHGGDPDGFQQYIAGFPPSPSYGFRPLVDTTLIVFSLISKLRPATSLRRSFLESDAIFHEAMATLPMFQIVRRAVVSFREFVEVDIRNFRNFVNFSDQYTRIKGPGHVRVYMHDIYPPLTRDLNLVYFRVAMGLFDVVGEVTVAYEDEDSSEFELRWEGGK